MEQVRLRQWIDADFEPYAAMNADPEVMRYFPQCMTRDESAASMERQRRAIDERGWGFWAVEVDGVFAGFTGLNRPGFSAAFTPCVEIGWRFHQAYWGRGVAKRAAEMSLRYGFETLQLQEIVSFTASLNRRSWKLMERLGFERDPGGDFEHPLIPAGHPLSMHLLYRKVLYPSKKMGS